MWTLDNQTFLVIARNPGQKLWLGETESVTTESNQALRVFGSGEIVLGSGWWDCVAVVDGNYLGPWFDGSNPPPGLLSQWSGISNASSSVAGIDEVTYYISRWLGTPGNSASKMTTYAQPDRTNLHPRPQANSSIGWSTYSTPSGESEDIPAESENTLRGVKSLSSSPSARIEVNLGTSGMYVSGITPGKTYTLSASVAAIPGDTSMVSLIIGWRSGTTTLSSVSSQLSGLSTEPETPSRRHITATAPAGADNCYTILRMTNATMNSALYGGLALLEEGPISLPYFDGANTPPKPVLPTPEGASGIRVMVDGEFKRAKVKVYSNGAFI